MTDTVQQKAQPANPSGTDVHWSCGYRKGLVCKADDASRNEGKDKTICDAVV